MVITQLFKKKYRRIVSLLTSVLRVPSSRFLPPTPTPGLRTLLPRPLPPRSQLLPVGTQNRRHTVNEIGTLAAISRPMLPFYSISIT